MKTVAENGFALSSKSSIDEYCWWRRLREKAYRGMAGQDEDEVDDGGRGNYTTSLEEKGQINTLSLLNNENIQIG